MKIKTRRSTWEEIARKPKIPHVKPIRPPFLFRLLVRLLSIPALFAVRFSYTKTRMDKAGEGPYLILMNHSGFLDLKIASKILFPMPYGIVSTTDSFVGKKNLMRLLGCIPTQKFVTDVTLVLDMIRIIKKEKRSILMYPEAGYSLDGTATVLPRRLGGMLKRLAVPVLLIRTDAGGFLRDPLYNALRLRRVPVTADLQCLLTREEVAEKSVEELDAILDEAFSFDHFAEQKEKGIRITEPTRATGLERVLYRCPHCEREGRMRGEGIRLTCLACGKTYRLEEDGSLCATDGESAFTHIPDWFRWQRECVRAELEAGTYEWEARVRVGAICDHKCLYELGEATLRQDRSGITLRSCDGSFCYHQDPWSSYSLNVDFFWYEIGDVIGIGNKERLYYCFPMDSDAPVVRARFAAEEMYRMPKLVPTAENINKI